ncbi:glycoside hydrolase family 130 protein [Novipirellula artificiosorum]|uniref:Beta-1,4-mannooligosaccharide phosphorylase n=1 Tax=Novipirellula artificiosorum TaxID=2528016 RepID=A0A5C6DCU2_9BACT|nr:glycosidase [Novipirellula artificiosorum]TWU35053.1 Beta-1,4-mannooligosaccharide phosphorylase [Novipirellula artificiosorum]
MERQPPPVTRCTENPIVVPGKYPWRMATVFNPAVHYEDGIFTMFERTAGQLRPFICYIGMLQSVDGVHFDHVSDEPIFTPEMAGSRLGSVQDPRIAKIEGVYYMTYAYRPFAWNSHPTGVGVPESFEPQCKGHTGNPADNMTRTGILRSENLRDWKHHSWATPKELDDRDVILFPEKIRGRFAAFRRPLQFVGDGYGTDRPTAWISYSDDLHDWSSPELIDIPRHDWESSRMGMSTPPIKTEQGWLAFHHGVEVEDPTTRRVVYRLGAMMLDLENPAKVIRRPKRFLMQPETYYEKVGLYIPNVVFPTAAIAIDDSLHLYYGVCDTAIALATVSLSETIEWVMSADPPEPAGI